jgi:AraC family cel operon transcriptional repressor
LIEETAKGMARGIGVYTVLKWHTSAGPQPFLKAVRHTMRPPGLSWVAHQHDFFEVFWVEKGSGLHFLNGTETVLREGDALFIRDDDAHTFIKPLGKTWVWVNISLSAYVEQELRGRYAPQMTEWPWRKDLPTFQGHLKPYHVSRLAERVSELPNTVDRWMDVDWMMSEIFRLLVPSGIITKQKHLPPWLATVLEEIKIEDGTFIDFERMIARTGYSREHVNRVVQTHFGMTTTALLRHVRLEHAARQLRLTNNDIFAVAQSAGFDNLSYFYRCFRQQYGVAPRQFRMQT